MGLVMDTWRECMKKWSGEEHRPILTGVEVKGLAVEGMRVEIEVAAVVLNGGN